jgi:hypothetical protein
MAVDNRVQSEGAVGITGDPTVSLVTGVDNRTQSEGSIGITDDVTVSLLTGIINRTQPEGPIGITDLGSSRAAIETFSNPVSITDTLTVVKTIGAPIGGRPKAYVTGTWQKKPGKVYIGGQWVEKPFKKHNGTTWVPIT